MTIFHLIWADDVIEHCDDVILILLSPSLSLAEISEITTTLETV